MMGIMPSLNHFLILGAIVFSIGVVASCGTCLANSLHLLT